MSVNFENRHLNEHPTFLIIGAGLAGLTSAVELGRRNISVQVVHEPNNELEATKACHGISTIKGILESDASLFGLKLEGHRRFHDWLTGLENELSSTRPDGVWMEGVREKFSSLEEFRKEFGRIYRRDFIGAKKVSLRTDHREGFAEAFYPGDWWIDPAYLVETLWRGMKTFGVGNIEGSVRSIKYDRDRFTVTTSSGMSLDATNVIVCAGVGSVEILDHSNMSYPDLLAVAGYTFKITQEGPPICIVKGTSGITRSQGYLHWGSTSDRACRISSTTRYETLRSLDTQQEISLAMNHLKTLTDETKIMNDGSGVRWGARVRTQSRDPFFQKVFEHRNGAVWLNTGYYKSGIILSHLFASRFAEDFLKREDSAKHHRR